MDKAGKKYWNDLWDCEEIPEAVDPAGMQLRNWVNRRFDRFFTRLFDKSKTSSMRLLEVGCAKSAWLPYFSKEFGFEVSGLDYSPVGCRMAKKILKENSIKAEVICADLFSPPSDMLSTFDVVVSFGVVEHFENTADSLSAISSFLKPGGMLITIIPNMTGWIGSIEKAVNRPVYDTHRLIDKPMLREQHERAGLEVLECDYFIAVNFGVCNLVGIPTNTFSWLLKKFFLGFLARVSIVVWWVEDRIGEFRPRRTFSPYINCVAHKR